MKKISYFLFTAILIIFLPPNLFGQNRINLGLNVKQFRFKADTSLVEIYYGYLSDFKSVNSKYAFELTISKEGQIITRNIWGVENNVQISDSGITKLNVDVLCYLLTPGNYNFRLIGKDLNNPQRIDSVEISEYTIRALPPEMTCMSDIELSQGITPVQGMENDKFVKNHFRVMPSVLNYYDLQNPQVYYYLEIYHLKKSFKGPFYNIKRTILDAQGLPVSAIPVYNKKKRIRGNDDIEVGVFDIQKLPSGKYNLHLAIVDSSGHAIAAQLVPFYVDNPSIMPINRINLSVEQQMQRSEVAIIDVNELDMILGAMKYLLPESEKKVVDYLKDEEAKRLFIYKFWKNRDEKPETASLESFRDFLWRLQYANANFSAMKQKGWQTDRGRILITYGKPSEIQYYPNVPDFKEFQAWSYDEIENGVVFIFGVLGSFGDLKLLHSTKTGELYNEGWLDLLKVSHGRTGIAEETMGLDAKEYMRKIFRDNNLEWPRYLK